VDQIVTLLDSQFESRNVRSFVRQLNLYRFRKVKTAKGILQYQHKSFRQGNKDGLGSIRRNGRSIDKEKRERPKRESNRMRFKDEITALKQRIAEMQKSRDEMTQQNERLINSNKARFTEIWNIKYFSLIKFQKLFFVFLSIVYGNCEGLIEAIFRHSLKPTITSNDSNTLLLNILERFKASGLEFFTQMMDQNSPDTPLLDSFVKLTCQVLTSPNTYSKDTSILNFLKNLTSAVNFDTLVKNIAHSNDFAKLKDLLQMSFNEMETKVSSKATEERFEDNSPDFSFWDFFSLNHSNHSNDCSFNQTEEHKVDRLLKQSLFNIPQDS
jgi:hypothetical protein